jgi:hypothetical protein
MRNLCLLTLTCGFLFAMGAPTRAERYSPRVGQPHADFTLPTLAEREPVSLTQFRGRKVLLIHFSSW